MRVLLIAFPCLLTCLCNAQDFKTLAKKDLTELSQKFTKTKELFEKEKEKLLTVSSSFEKEEIDSYYKSALKLKNEVDSIYKLRDNYINYYQLKAIQLDSLNHYFPEDKDWKTSEVEKPKSDDDQEIEVYTYYGQNLVIKEDFLNDKAKESDVFKNILDEKSEKSYLGDITIPGENQEITFYKYSSNSSEKKVKGSTSEKGFIRTQNDAKFKKVAIEIRDGSFADIRAYVQSEDGNVHIFENKIGISILRYSTYGKKNYLFYKHSHKKGNSANNYKDTDLEHYYIKLSDVMVYDYKVGNHFIPNNLVLELPQKDENDRKTNADGPVTYQIKEDTHLDNVIELRAYTDFLALFGDSNNGLVQFEGNANFYVVPFPMALFGNANLMELTLINQLSPYVNYSRFDDDVRYVALESNASGISSPKSELDLIEKRYLMMGIDANLLQLQSKDLPFKINLYGNLNYQLSEIKRDDTVTQSMVVENVKAMGFGGGVLFNFKRFNNFGFNYKAGFTWYDYKNFNTIENLSLPRNILVFSNEAELFYYPNGKPNQAIFARLRTFNNSATENNEAFYQFQFGYKFSIGTRAVKK